jgi:hypothetical protein
MSLAKFGTRIGTLLVGLLAVTAALPGAHALANAPTIETTHTVFTRVVPFFSQACGFTVVRHRDLTIRTAIFTDRSGNVVKELDNYQDNGYFQANGITVNYSEAGPNHVTYYADGSVLYSGSGLFYNYRGPEYRFAGRVATLVDADGNVISDSFHGIDRGSLDDLCAALTP